MKLTPKILAYSSILVYWGPSNALFYGWGFLLLVALALIKTEWISPVTRNQKNITICILAFFAVVVISCLVNFLSQNTSLNNLLWTLITYGSSFAALHVFLNLPYHEDDIKSIVKFSLIITLLEIVLGYYQMLFGSSFQSFNPFTLNSNEAGAAGDLFVGTTFDVGIGNEVAVKVSMVALLFFPFWVASKSFKNSLLLIFLFIGWLLPSAIYTLFIGLSVIFLYFLFKRIVMAFQTLRLSLTIFFTAALVFVSVLAFMTLQPSNISYVKVLVTRGYNTLTEEHVDNPLGKLVYYKETFASLFSEYPHATLIGVGPGNYSSRSAWLVSGAYLDNQPLYIPVTPSKAAQNYTLTFWRKEFITKAFPDASSITYQPFSSWLSVFSEFGILGLFFFTGVFYFMSKIIDKVEAREDKKLSNFVLGTRIVTTYILLLFFFDNLFEWPLVMGQFFILIGLLARIQAIHEMK